MSKVSSAAAKKKVEFGAGREPELETKKRRKFVIDTDPGVDDAMAIMMALDAHKRGDIEIVAITLVNGNTKVQCAQINILRILDTFNMVGMIPVFVGAEMGLVHEFHFTHYYHGEDGFNDLPFDKMPDLSQINRDETASSAICKIVNNNPDEINLICLGPLTNIATCINMDIKFSTKLYHIYLMGGNLGAIGNTSVCAEFNFEADPEAAHVVLSRTCCPITIVPWETCWKKINIPWKWRMNTLGGIDTSQAKLMNYVEEPVRKRRQFDQWVACDQLIMAVAINPSCNLKATLYEVDVELQGKHTRGMMVIEKRSFLKDTTTRPLQGSVSVVEELDLTILKYLLLRSLGHKV